MHLMIHMSTHTLRHLLEPGFCCFFFFKNIKENRLEERKDSFLKNRKKKTENEVCQQKFQAKSPLLVRVRFSFSFDFKKKNAWAYP